MNTYKGPGEDLAQFMTKILRTCIPVVAQDEIKYAQHALRTFSNKSDVDDRRNMERPQNLS
jgi:hypothetical protein